MDCDKWWKDTFHTEQMRTCLHPNLSAVLDGDTDLTFHCRDCGWHVWMGVRGARAKPDPYGAAARKACRKWVLETYGDWLDEST